MSLEIAVRGLVSLETQPMTIWKTQTPLRLLAVGCLAALGLLTAAEPASKGELILTDAAGKEQKLKTWKFTTGLRHLTWLAPPAPAEKKEPEKKDNPKIRPIARPAVGPPALAFREEKSTGFFEGILTLIPLDRLKSLEYDREAQTVTAKVATADPAKDETLTGTTRYGGVNKLTIEAEVDKGDMGVAELRFLAGVPKGIRGIRFPAAKAPAADKGRPAQVIDTDKKEKTTHKVTDLQALYRLPDGTERLLPLLMFKKTLKVDLGKVKKLTAGDGGTLQSPEWTVTSKDGEDQTLSLLKTIPLEDKQASWWDWLAASRPVTSYFPSTPFPLWNSSNTASGACERPGYGRKTGAFTRPAPQEVISGRFSPRGTRLEQEERGPRQQRCRPRVGQEMGHQAIDRRRLFHVRRMAAVGHHQEVAVGQIADGRGSFLRGHDSILSPAHQQSWLRDQRQPLAGVVSHGTADGPQQTDSPTPAGELLAVELHQHGSTCRRSKKTLSIRPTMSLRLTPSTIGNCSSSPMPEGHNSTIRATSSG